MIQIYKLTPEPKLMGSFDNGILKIGEIGAKMTRDEVLDRFNRGYYRTGEV